MRWLGNPLVPGALTPKLQQTRGLDPMAIDADRIKGVANQVGGAIKENVGAATGDAKTEAEGAAQRAGGKVQNAAGGAKDAVRDVVKKD